MLLNTGASGRSPIQAISYATCRLITVLVVICREAAKKTAGSDSTGDDSGDKGKAYEDEWRQAKTVTSCVQVAGCLQPRQLLPLTAVMPDSLAFRHFANFKELILAQKK